MSRCNAQGLLAALALALATLPPAACGEAPAAAAGALRVASSDASQDAPHGRVAPPPPAWAVGAVFYQVFPERFRNGDPTNDPTRDSLEFPENVSDRWRVTPWTGDWYGRARWERERGPNFYEQGVFDRRYGGDLQGLLDKLDYLADLGVDALYLNPVFYARSLHKYDGASFHHIDPYFGPDPRGDLKLIDAETSDPRTWRWTAADRLFLKLLSECKRRGLRVILDGVFNHTGRRFFAFEDLARRQAESPYKDWYVVQAFDDPATPQNEFRYKGWWGVDTLPELANDPSGDNLHPGPKEYIFAATRRWMDPNADGDPADGIDGWRLDVANEVPTGFWREWHALVRGLNPQAYTVAEHWHNAAEFLADGGFTATMNYHGFAMPTKGFLIDGTLSASDAGRMLTERSLAFPTATRSALMSLIDSHDTDRVASMIVNRPGDRPYVQPDRFDYDVGERASARNWDGYEVRKPNALERRIQRLVTLMQATFIGAPTFYYGDEAGMWGGDDPCDRMPMVWEDLTYSPQRGDPLGRPRDPDPVAFDAELFARHRDLLRARRRLPALRDGAFEVVLADDATQTLAFRRGSGPGAVLVVLHRGEAPCRVTLPVDNARGLRPVQTASGDPAGVRARPVAGGLRLELPAIEGVVLARDTQE